MGYSKNRAFVKVDVTGEVDKRFDEVTSQLADIFVNVKNFGAIGDGVANDTQPILDALESIKDSGGVLFFPRGIFLTDPISLIGYRNIVIQGQNSTTFFVYKEQTVLKIRSVGDVGIKCSETGVETPVDVGKGITIENIFLNCDFKVDIGMNMNLAVTVKNTAVRYSKGDGIVLEGQSYPVQLNRVVSQNNSGHGLRIKAPFTTVYNIYDCEFSFNDLYGVYIEDGSTSILQNMLIQGNKQGGLKIKKRAPDTYSLPIFLERLTFIGLYTEANGTLGVSHDKYDGDYAIKIEGYNENPLLGIGKITDLTFINSSNNKSSYGQFASIKGTNSMKAINSPNIQNYIDVEKNRVVAEYIGSSRFEGLIDLTRAKGGNIQFPSTPNPSPNLNTLDEYKEGDFTPEIGQLNAGNFTKTGNDTSHYIKIGSLVTCFIDLTWTDKGTTSGVYGCTLKNLPYSSLSGVGKNGSFVNVLVSGGSTDSFSISPVSSQDVATFNKNGNADGTIISEMPLSGRLTGVLTYRSST